MKDNTRIPQKHWFHVTVHFLIDVLLVFVAFLLADLVRFGEEAGPSIWLHFPHWLIGAMAFSAATYIAGLYSPHSANQGGSKRVFILGACSFAAALVIIGASYLSFARPPGRGVILIGSVLSQFFVVIHHLVLVHTLRTNRDRVAYVVTSAFDEVETRVFSSNLCERNVDFVGVIRGGAYEPSGKAPILGSIDHLEEIVRREDIHRILCTSKSLSNPTLTRYFCKLRYAGISVTPLIVLFEEIEQHVPLELITHEWLLHASGKPQLLYIKKVKRLFDILASIAGLILGAPLIVLGALAVKATSQGPAFYRQVRQGRFGREFSMLKLRTMRVDAEAQGAQWSGKHDPRVTWVGRFLRRYRIDEIPQLLHVLMGEMSFVGPRPERPELIKDLALKIPYYEERLMIQPGLTGWAQVSYPYGASVLDARRKLEYDLYYMKHMSVFLDLFILLDTVRTVLTGGVKVLSRRSEPPHESLQEWERIKDGDHPSTPPDLKLETA